jgi:hypothetical protein
VSLVCASVRVRLARLHLFGSDKDRVIVFVCECTDAACRETVLLTAPQFDARTADGDLVVHPHHAVA